MFDQLYIENLIKLSVIVIAALVVVVPVIFSTLYRVHIETQDVVGEEVKIN
jgi:hypothetical protein